MKSKTLLKCLSFFCLLFFYNQIYGVEVNNEGSINLENNLIDINDESNRFNVGGTLTVKSATCVNNGAITSVASGGNGSPKLYIFTLTSGPTSNGQVYPTSDQYNATVFTFNDLYPGTYQVTIEDANDSGNPPFIQNITVVDNTENLDFALTPQDPDCPGANTGSLQANVSSGVGPYQYQILTGPSGTTTGLISDANQTYTFNNLPEGSYFIRVYDICGNYQTRSYVLSDPSLPSLNLYSSGNPRIERITCTEAIYKVGGSGGTGYGTFTYEVVGGAPAGYDSTNTTGTFTLPINQAPYTFQVTDGCGQTATYTHSNPNAYLQWSAMSRNCSGWSLQIRTNWMVGPFTYTLTNVPAGYTGPMSNTTGAFDLPYGYVSYSVTDACGTVRYGSTTRTQEPIQINGGLTVETIDNCIEGTGRVEIRYNNSSNGAVAPVTFELTTVPAGFTGNAGPQYGSSFSGLMPGNYLATAIDACGNTDTYPFEIMDVLEVDVQGTVNIGCVNSSTIEVNVTSNNSYLNSGTRRYRLYDANTNALVKSGVIYGSGPSTYTFTNIAPGEYYAEFYRSNSCRYQSETLIVLDYEQPTISSLNSYNCSGTGLTTISGVTAGGAEPFTFTLINNANNQVITTSSDCYFPNQNASLSYSVRIEDNCGNSTSTQVTPVSTGLGLEFEGDLCGEVGDTFPVYLRRYRGMTYSWTFPDNSTYNGHDPRSTIGIIDINDFGVYTLQASTLDGCRTETLIINFNNCPPPSIDFDGVDDFITAPDSFDLSNWNELTIQFWAKANSAVQSAAGIVGQQGVFEVSKSNSLEYNVVGQGNAGSYSKTQWLDDSDTWQHITIVYKNGVIKTYHNGELEHTEASSGITSLASSSNTFNIGGRIKSSFPSNYFHGWIDEVRVFDIALTDSQLQQIVYQEIENNNGSVKGSVIPKDVEDFDTGERVSWSNLKLYYKMGTDFTTDDRVIDYSGNENHGTIHNITTWQEETAPMPYQTKQNGNWENTSTWLHGDVWDIASGIKFPNLNTSDNVNCAIIKISHNVFFDYSNFYPSSFPTAHAKEGLTQIGLIVDSGKKLTVASDKYINNLLYLELNGTIDLLGDSQLLQAKNSDLVTSTQGKILRRQEGNSSVYWYNYWASPVGILGATNLDNNNGSGNNLKNTSFNMNMLKTGTGSQINFTSLYHEIGKLSTYWLYTYRNGLTYYDWAFLDVAENLKPGEGYTQKGTGVGTQQQYIFEGKPNNGTIIVPVTDTGGNGSVPAVSKTDYLLGNPYASAIDLHKFIDDNAGVIDGTIQLWQQWSGASHVLDEYNGGYAQVNKTGSIRAYQFVGIEGATNGNQDGTKKPSKYLPVGQGFMTEIVNGGNIVFKNSQRVFIKESDANGTYNSGSVFFRNGSSSKTENTSEDAISEDGVMQKLRLEFNSVDGSSTRRELLLGFSTETSDDYDYGYDAKNVEEYADDLNLVLADELMTIQAYSEITADKVVPLTLKASGSYNYTIALTETENITEDQAVFIKDNLTGEYYDLRNEQPYEFTSEAGEYANRLEIVFQDQSESLSITDQSIDYLNIYYASNRKKIVVLNPENKEIRSLEVYNILGQSVYSNHNIYEGKYNEFELHNMSTGTYIVKLVTDDNAMLSKKIIVK